MKNLFICICFCFLLGSILSSAGCSGQSFETAQRAKLTKQFMKCLPDSLDDVRREEIFALFDLFWKRSERELVYPEDIEEITEKLKEYVKAGSITGKDLLFYMAQVGYYTYRMDPRYNLPEGFADHPTINPNAALIGLVPDSTGQLQGYCLPPRAPDDSTTKKTLRRGLNKK